MGRSGAVGDLISPISFGAAVTPSDSTVLTATRALWVGGAGDVAVEMTGGSVVTLAAVPAGSLLPLRCAKVRATGTTATSIVALW